MKNPPFVSFDWRAVLVQAEAVLSRPPAKAHIKREPGVGRLVRRFALPLELCPTTNATRYEGKGKHAKIKADITTVMLVQTQGRIRNAPLPGRPMVIGIRFSRRAPDKYSDGFKMAIDRLMVGKDRLGYLRDDSPAHCEVVQRWELAPPEAPRGFAILEIYTGAPEALSQTGRAHGS